MLWREPRPENRGRGIGLRTADEIRFPLDPYRVLVLVHKDLGLPARVPADEQRIKDTNEFTAAYAYDWLFHNPERTPLEEVILEREQPLFHIGNTPIHRERGVNEALRGVPIRRNERSSNDQ